MQIDDRLRRAALAEALAAVGARRRRPVRYACVAERWAKTGLRRSDLDHCVDRLVQRRGACLRFAAGQGDWLLSLAPAGASQLRKQRALWSPAGLRNALSLRRRRLRQRARQVCAGSVVRPSVERRQPA